MTAATPPWKRYAPPGRDITAADLEREGLSEAEGWRRCES